eukprot:3725774-Rhodomonas_salina.1
MTVALADVGRDLLASADAGGCFVAGGAAFLGTSCLAFCGAVSSSSFGLPPFRHSYSACKNSRLFASSSKSPSCKLPDSASVLCGLLSGFCTAPASGFSHLVSPVSLQCQKGFPAVRDCHSCHTWYPSKISPGRLVAGRGSGLAGFEATAKSGIQKPPVSPSSGTKSSIPSCPRRKPKMSTDGGSVVSESRGLVPVPWLSWVEASEVFLPAGFFAACARSLACSCRVWIVDLGTKLVGSAGLVGCIGGMVTPSAVAESRRRRGSKVALPDFPRDF